MGFSQFFIISPRGDTLVRRDFRGDVPGDSAEIFFREARFYGGVPSKAPPIFHHNNVTYFYQMENELFFMATCTKNVSPCLGAEVLNRMIRIFKDYCGTVTEESIIQNFTLLYELLDEILDFGLVQETSSELLKAYVFNEPVSSLKSKIRGLKGAMEMGSKTTPSTATDKPINWSRKSKAKNQKNEIFVDIFERITVTFNANGYILNSQIDGAIQMKSYLSGNPELKLALNEDLVIGNVSNNYGAVKMDDCNFHECVRFDEFEDGRALLLYPPDGEFTVLNYRINGEFRCPFRIFPFLESSGSYKQELLIKVRADIPEQNYGGNVVISVPVPKCATSVTSDLQASSSSGQTAEYMVDKQMYVWRIKKFQGGTEEQIRLRIVLGKQHTASIRKEIGPIAMKFEIPMYSVSNVQVKYLRILEDNKSYNPYRWVRYVTRSESYVCRL